MVRRFGFSEMLTGVTMALVGITVLSGAVLASVPVSADDDASVDDVSIVVPTACTLSGTGTGAHTATINPGQYVTDIGTTTLKALCNDANGFAIYATGYTGNTIGETNSNKLVGQNTSETIVTGLATSGDTSYWAMKLATDSTATYPVTIESAPNTSGGSPASFASYHVVPNEYTKVATRLQSTDVGTNATGSTLTTTYATYISAGQVGDTYNGKVIYTLVHPNTAPVPMAPLLDSACPPQSICYAPNSSDIDGSMSSLGAVTGSDTAGKQTGVATNGEVTLIASNYSRDGYGFAGWSTDFKATSSSKIYGPNEAITISTTAGSGDADVSEHGLILYPVWVASAGSIQDWTDCSTLTVASYDSASGKINANISSVTALTDQRDGNTYAVARLVDGNCWMTENLRLDAEDTLGDANKALAQGYGDDTANSRGRFIGLPNSENANFNDTKPPVSNNLYSIDGSNDTINIGNTRFPYGRIPRYNNNNTNRALTASYNGEGNSTYYQWYAYGNYYNWPAVMASTNPLFESSLSEVAGTSLCPSGWKLPLSGVNDSGGTAYLDSFAFLDTQMGGAGSHYQYGSAVVAQLKKWRTFPNNFAYSGYFYDSSMTSRGTTAKYWSSSAAAMYSNDDPPSAVALTFRDDYISLSAQPNYTGISVRCLLGS